MACIKNVAKNYAYSSKDKLNDKENDFGSLEPYWPHSFVKERVNTMLKIYILLRDGLFISRRSHYRARNMLI